MRQQLRVHFLHHVDPSWAAARKHRKRAAIFDPLEQLVRFLDNRQIGREVGVEDVVEAKHLERRNKLSRRRASWRESKGFRQRHAHGRRGLYDGHILARVTRQLALAACCIPRQPSDVDIALEQTFDIHDGVFFRNRCNRTRRDAGAAGNALCIGELQAVNRRDDLVIATRHDAKNVHALELATRAHAAKTQHAHLEVEFERR
mmetsp:Transcript_14609/g.39087  ORF Transcript_14609/g.39087 Transcript_14609/m.39087 type:complete len:203 (+) Transcript_14609:1207-1815(+)